ncbi:MAG: hypothetical protein OEY49_16510 [Candidatus Heimdallarchaeota archaeon]|nr:hypothetical protein [Candidatus Heimdallarchaeota archaeon]
MKYNNSKQSNEKSDKVDSYILDQSKIGVASNVGSSAMAEAYRLSKRITMDRLEKEDQENMDILKKLESSDVLVIDGTYDHIHLVLQHIELPFIQITQDQAKQIKFRPDQTVFVNCPRAFDSELARQLATFVFEGGQLITTDWALKNVIEVGFPGLIEYNKRATADDVVRIEVIDTSDEIIKGFLDEETDPVWWLEGSSYPIKILDAKVQIVMRSKELGEKYGEEPVIVKFNHGKGIVYHMISHFYLQRTETRDKKHESTASEYAKTIGASKNTVSMMKESIANYGQVQSANTSAEFISRAILNQKKRFRDNK